MGLSASIRRAKAGAKQVARTYCGSADAIHSPSFGGRADINNNGRSSSALISVKTGRAGRRQLCQNPQPARLEACLLGDRGVILAVCGGADLNGRDPSGAKLRDLARSVSSHAFAAAMQSN